jgi:8-oxo-dGTP pyrophosphatase MutT (NUDIX family)
MLVRDRAGVTDVGTGVGIDVGIGVGTGGVEVFMFRRVASMPFAAGMQVFPGGRVDERDADERVPWQGPAARTFAGPLSAEVGLARALVVAAVRETFEECAVLLAGPPGGGVVRLTEADWTGGWQERRRRLLAGDVGLADVLLESGLVLRADLVHPWAHWITPPGEVAHRYDTRFFVAAMPPGQHARDLGGEGEQARWLPAAEGVRQYVEGESRMLPPTVVCLEDMAAAPSVSALLATRRRIRPVTPWPVRLEDGGIAVEVDLDGLGGGQPRA